MIDWKEFINASEDEKKKIVDAIEMTVWSHLLKNLSKYVDTKIALAASDAVSKQLKNDLNKLLKNYFVISV